MRRIMLGTVLSLAFAAAPLAAQEPVSRISLEPYAGAFVDSYDISPDGERTAPLVGVRLGYDLGGRARLLADAAFATTANVSNPSGLSSYHLYENQWLLTTVGAEYDVIPGRTSLSLGLRAGAGWRDVELTGKVGEPGDGPRHDAGGFDPVDVVVPSLTLRRDITSRAALRLTLADHAFDVLEGPAKHSPAISLGLSLR